MENDLRNYFLTHLTDDAKRRDRSFRYMQLFSAIAPLQSSGAGKTPRSFCLCVLYYQYLPYRT